MATMTSTEFNRNPSRARKLAAKEPVFVTDRGMTTQVLLSATDYERLTLPQGENWVRRLAMTPEELAAMGDDDFDDLLVRIRREGERGRYWDFGTDDYRYSEPSPGPDESR